MKETQASNSAGKLRLAGPTPLERSWSAAAVLLVWLGTFAAVSFADGDGDGVSGWGRVGSAVTYAASGALIGLVVFLPARTSAAAVRVGIYALAVLLGFVLLLMTEPGIFVGLAIAFLPPWALLTALYGLRGGLPTGRRCLALYAAAALVGMEAGYIAVRIFLGLAFAGFPGGLFGWLLPLLPLLLLLQNGYRRNSRRTVMEIVLSALAAACGAAWFGFLGYGPGWSPDLGVLFALSAWVVAVIPTAVLLGLGYIERFDTAEYQSRAEQRTSAEATPEGKTG